MGAKLISLVPPNCAELAIAVRPKFATAEASAWVVDRCTDLMVTMRRFSPELDLGVGLISTVLQAGDAWCQHSSSHKIAAFVLGAVGSRKMDFIKHA